MYCMSVTLEVSKLSSWLNAAALWNMYCMFVTLDVSRLSGWLNADAVCRVEREAWEEERHAGRAAGGRGATVAQAACLEDPTVEVAGRARARRTLNMEPMLVTLDVSRLSGWLNACAFCRVEREA